MKLKLADKPKGQINYGKIAKLTPNYSGADLEAIVDIAIESVLESAIETGVPKPLDTELLLQSIKQHRASTVDWFSTAKNYAMFANNSGQYDPIVAYLKQNKDL